jgi:hypothetical protein
VLRVEIVGKGSWLPHMNAGGGWALYLGLSLGWYDSSPSPLFCQHKRNGALDLCAPATTLHSAPFQAPPPGSSLDGLDQTGRYAQKEPQWLYRPPTEKQGAFFSTKSCRRGGGVLFRLFKSEISILIKNSMIQSNGKMPSSGTD